MNEQSTPVPPDLSDIFMQVSEAMSIANNRYKMVYTKLTEVMQENTSLKSKLEVEEAKAE